MRAFVTGGAGFIGSHMVEALLASPDRAVTVYDNLSSGRLAHLKRFHQHPRFRFVQGDLLQSVELEEAVRGHDFVFHFAANSDIAKGAMEPGVDFHHSIVATFNLLEAMRKARIPKVVFASGSGVYGDQGSVSLAETFGPLLPISMYGAGKLAAEAMLSAYAHLYDLTAYVYRCANVVGARQTHGVAFDVIRKLKANPRRLKILGDGHQEKSYLHVSDLLDAIMLVISNGRERVSLYNVATDDRVTVRWIAEQVVKQMGLEDVEFVFGDSRRGWQGDVPVVRLDLDTIHRLGWAAKLNSQEAIRRSIRELLEGEKSS